VVKLLGFINTIVMARLLLPEDYGIVAMGMLVVGLIQTFLDFGATTALLRKAEISKAEINAAWTLKLIQSISAATILLLISPIASDFYAESNLTYILWTFSACILLAGLTNISPTLAQREFKFEFNFKIDIYAKLASVVVTLITGIILRDYRALVMGIATGYFAPLILSYVWHPYRPAWDTEKLSEVWSVSKWILFSNIGSFTLRKGDELIASRIGTTHEYGLYNVGSDFGQLPVGEIGPAMMQALMPVLATIQNDVERTRLAVIKTLSAVSTVIWPIGVGFAAVAPQAIELVLGAKWLSAIPITIAYALISILRTTQDPLSTLMVIFAHIKAASNLVWIEFFVFVLAALLLVPNYHIIGLVVARLCSSLLSTITSIWLANRTCGLSIKAVFFAIARPALGAALMYMLVTYYSRFVEGITVQLMFSIFAGGVFYVLWCLATWRATGKPEGLESTLIDKFLSK